MIVLLGRLWLNFFMTGLFSIGGGLATLPFLYQISDRTGWFTYHQLMDMLAVSESTPGAIGVNMSTYVGFTTASIPGALSATLGLIMPSIVIILVVARILEQFRDSHYVQLAFNGLKPASMGLIFAAGFSVAKIVFLNTDLIGKGSLPEIMQFKALLLGAILFVLMQKYKQIHPAAFIGLSAAVGVIFSFAQ